MGHVMAQLIEQSMGVQARIAYAGHESNHSALLAGEIDLYAEYLGTALRRYLGLTPVRDAEATYRLVRDASRERWGLEWLPAFGFNNSYALIMHARRAAELGIGSISELLPHAARLRLGGIEPMLTGDPKITFAPGGYAALCR